MSPVFSSPLNISVDGLNFSRIDHEACPALYISAVISSNTSRQIPHAFKGTKKKKRRQHWLLSHSYEMISDEFEILLVLLKGVCVYTG